MSYLHTLDYLYSLQRFGIKLGLANILRLLDLLDNPQKGIRTVIIGGTNGKGSCAAILSSLLGVAGHRVGLYTSPHLHDFRERIRVGNELISYEEVMRLTDVIREAMAREALVLPLTFFEFVTAMAFLYFREKKVDLAILEVGMGGRLDATNVTEPEVAVITSVARDHCQHLGQSLTAIAREKLGIVKPGRPLVAGVEGLALARQVARHCRRLGSPLLLLEKDFSYLPNGQGGFDYFGLSTCYPGLRLSLAGPHQMANAALALAAAETLEKQGYCLDAKAIRKGLAQVNWPGRLELFPTASRVLMDCAHNPAGCQALVEALGKEYIYEHLILVVGIMQDKDWPTMLSLLAPLADLVIVTQPELERACPAEALAGQARKWCQRVEVIPQVSSALARGREVGRSRDLVLVTGSIFTVSEARASFLLNN